LGFLGKALFQRFGISKAATLLHTLLLPRLKKWRERDWRSHHRQRLMRPLDDRQNINPRHADRESKSLVETRLAGQLMTALKTFAYLNNHHPGAAGLTSKCHGRPIENYRPTWAIET
jgi:hypothetical protein